jgi:phosphohistidine phosphatase SixA
MSRSRVLAFAAALAVALSGLLPADPASAQERKRRQELVPRFEGPEIVEKLKGGGHVLLIRHMTTVRNPDQWIGVDYDDCSTQRVLSDEGKQQARNLGQAFRNLEIPVGEVIVSPYCRCRETAKLAFGKTGTESETLSVWDELEMEEKTQRGTEIRKMLDTPPAPGTNTVLVTHTGNLLWSFGLDSKPEGLTHVFKPTGLAIGRPTYLGRVNPDEWRTLAGLPDPPPAAEEAPEAGEATADAEGGDAAQP